MTCSKLTIETLQQGELNCLCGIVDRPKAFSLISSRDHCQRSSPSRISDTPRAGFEPAQNLSSGLVEWSCAVVITTAPRCEICSKLPISHLALVFLLLLWAGKCRLGWVTYWFYGKVRYKFYVFWEVATPTTHRVSRKIPVMKFLFGEDGANKGHCHRCFKGSFLKF